MCMNSKCGEMNLYIVQKKMGLVDTCKKIWYISIVVVKFARPIPR